MGWSYAKLPDGREIGYSVEAVCEHPGCTVAINRGLAYACGRVAEVQDPIEPGSDTGRGCGHHFCPGHLLMGPTVARGWHCPACSDAYDRAHPEDAEVAGE